MKLKIYMFHILLFIAGLAQSQIPENGLVYTDLDKYNLKGQVQEITVRFDRFYLFDSLSRDKKREYEMLNDWQVREFPMGKHWFSPYGFIEQFFARFQDSIGFRPVDRRNTALYEFHYDLNDLREKSVMTTPWSYTFPVATPYKVRINHIMNITRDLNNPKSDDNYLTRFVYEINHKGLLTGELEVSLDSLPNIRKVNSLDQDGKVIRQDMIFKEWLVDGERLFMEVLLNMDIEMDINSEAYYAYEYDDIDRIKESKLVENGEVIWQENYAYQGNRRWPYEILRFVVSGRTFSKQLTDYAFEYYNEFGDILQSENYTAEDSLVRTRFYEYIYDEQNNWIQCYMYLEGQPERTPKPTIVAYRDIQYYTSEEVETAWKELLKTD